MEFYVHNSVDYNRKERIYTTHFLSYYKLFLIDSSLTEPHFLCWMEGKINVCRRINNGILFIVQIVHNTCDAQHQSNSYF